MEDYAKFKILIVDDDEILRDTIAFDFKRKGFTIFEAENAVSALALVKSHKIDLVLSDIRMPGGDGITLLEQIRLIDPLIPIVIFMTGFADFTEEACIAKGASTVINKPFDRQLLMTTIIKALKINVTNIA